MSPSENRTAGGSATASSATVGALGEQAVLEAVIRALGDAAQPSHAVRVGPGDDCAVLRHRGDTVITSDTMIEGTDFRLDWHTPFELGWKLAATNLSDVAAMGAKATSLTVALACPDSTEVRVLKGIAAGLAAACADFAPEVRVSGGDLSAAPVMMCAVTAVGELGERTAVLRSGAKPQDVVAYAGDLGLSGAGLRLLFEPPDSAEALKRSHPELLRAHLTPRPPLDADSRAATAMMDVSDGLVLDATRLARASRVRINLRRSQLEALNSVDNAARVSLDEQLYGGEDHGLLATFPPGTDLAGTGFAIIGEVRNLSDGVSDGDGTSDDNSRVTLDGRPLPARGWDPFAEAAAESLAKK